MSQTAAHNNAQSASCHTQQNAGFSPSASEKEGGLVYRGEISCSGNSQSLGNGFKAGDYSPREAQNFGGAGGALEGFAPIGFDDKPPTRHSQLRAVLSEPTMALAKRGADISPECLSDAARAAVADAVPLLVQISADDQAGARSRIKAVDSLVGIMTATAPKQSAAQVGIVIQGAPASTPESDLAAFEAAFERVE